MNPITLAIAIIALLFVVFLLTLFFYLSIWVRAMMAGHPVSILELIGMKLRRDMTSEIG